MAHGAPAYDDAGDRTLIPCTEMLPGDGCFHHDKFPGGGVNHVSPQPATDSNGTADACVVCCCRRHYSFLYVTA
jgi:hypothetical protein